MSATMTNFDFSLFQLFGKTHKEFFPYIRRYRKIFYFLFSVIFLLSISNTVMIWLLGKPFNYLSVENYEGLSSLLLLLFITILLNQTLHYYSTFHTSKLGLNYVGELRNAIFSKIICSPYQVEEEISKGDLLSRLSHDVDLMQRFIVELPFYLASHSFTLMLYAGMLIYIDWQLAVIALFLTPAFFVHQKLFSKHKRKAAQKFYDKNGKLLAQEDDYLASRALINSFNQQSSFSSKHENKLSDALFWAIKERRLDALFSTSLSVVVYFCAIFIVFLGVERIQSNQLSIAELVSFLLYMGYMSVPLRGITELFFQAQSDVMVGERLSPLLAIDVEDNASQTLTPNVGEINFNNVCFSLQQKSILSDVTFTIEAGKTVALVGGSGSGKSTIAKLLLRFYDPDSGEILIDDQRTIDVAKHNIRSHVSLVWQMPILIHDTIRNNLLLANRHANELAINKALEDSNSLEFVKNLPQGIDTLIGSKGVELSSGQKQRLHIAQAFLRNTSILIMDEATSALDSESEEKIVNNVKNNRQKLTTILIAHRYSSLKHADYILYLNPNGTVDSGTHEQLLKNHPGYEQALNWQTSAENKN